MQTSIFVKYTQTNMFGQQHIGRYICPHTHSHMSNLPCLIQSDTHTHIYMHGICTEAFFYCLHGDTSHTHTHGETHILLRVCGMCSDSHTHTHTHTQTHTHIHTNTHQQ